MGVTERFNGRANQYVKYRPSYSDEVIQYIVKAASLTQDSVVADIGAGTGKFTSKLLEQGMRVYAIEPNEEMRHSLLNELHTYLTEQNKAKRSLIVSSGSAELTELSDHSVDHIICAQSFHWFEPALARAEFIRIMKPKGNVFLLWNQRDSATSAFVQDYEAFFLAYGKQYSEVGHKRVSQQSLKPFFGGHEPQLASFHYEQQLDLEGLMGRIQSSSFSLIEGEPRFKQSIEQIYELYNKHQENGFVKMMYRTDIYWGSML